MLGAVTGECAMGERDEAHAAGRTPPFGALRRTAVIAVVALLVPIAQEAAKAQVSVRSDKEVVEAVCAACHATGANGAPKIGDEKAWRLRASQGLTSLTRYALQGIRKMPPHGGNPSLTDFEIELAITYMVNHSGGHWAVPINKAA